VLLLRGGAARLAGLGLLYAWILFFVEFSAVRFQEPFVLYRSYFWGPGFVCVAVAALSRLPRRGAFAAGLLACAALAYVAHDRLVTFSNPVLLWEDAVAKLPAQPVPWGSRALYQAGHAYLYAGQPRKAIDVAERCTRQYPKTMQCAYARGAIHLHLEQFELARQHLLRAIELRPDVGILHHRLGLALEGLERRDDAKAAYRRSLELGYGGARLELERLGRGERRWK
jgi:tetratricopeptide (TPR) repeat protein